MKKRKQGILLILSFLLIFMSLVSASVACKKGDANMDGDVDHADLYEIKELLRLIPEPVLADTLKTGAKGIKLVASRTPTPKQKGQCVPKGQEEKR
ncbi:MAG: hypothetical protein D3910_23045 [Candidatus Electrothrix sp. ATG2]|nr:hypothetical protein [Candidatus Electrothrix sp. ATG2]